MYQGSKNFSYSDGLPDARFKTILNVLEVHTLHACLPSIRDSTSVLTFHFTQVENDMVLRQLIINNRVESIILEMVRKNADAIMVSGPNGGFPPNVRACYTIDGFNVGSRYFYFLG